MLTTSSFSQAMEWALELFGELNVPRVWIPEKAFVGAARDGNSISFTRSLTSATGEGLFGLALGAHPIILPSWNEFAIPQGTNPEIASEFSVRHNWETHAIATRSQSYEIEPLEGVEEDVFIANFLDTHAPSSSARPGNPEIEFWGCVRNAKGEIAAIAAITQWESGEKMLSSVATHTDMRGQGFAQKVCAGVVGLAYDRGIERIHLVVLSENVAAIQAYAKIGFESVGKFTSYAR